MPHLSPVMAMLTMTAGTTAYTISESHKASKESKKQHEEAQASMAAEQAAIAKEREAKDAQGAATEAAAQKKQASRMALISTTPQGVLGGDTNLGRKKLLGN